MIRLGIIELSNSNWRSPIELVPKLDGSVRFYFWEVNKIATFDAYPMPRTDILLSKLGEACYMSTFDLTNGYWQVLLLPQDKKKTAFATPKGLYQFTVMLFGLHGAAAMFQWLVDPVLGLCEGFILTYLDNIAICSQTWEEHLSHLQQVARGRAAYQPQEKLA